MNIMSKGLHSGGQLTDAKAHHAWMTLCPTPLCIPIAKGCNSTLQIRDLKLPFPPAYRNNRLRKMFAEDSLFQSMSAGTSNRKPDEIDCAWVARAHFVTNLTSHPMEHCRIQGGPNAPTWKRGARAAVCRAIWWR